MATDRFSLTLFCPMNSPRRCGLSLSSNDESSSTGAAETRRSLRLGLFFASATLGDGKAKSAAVQQFGRNPGLGRDAAVRESPARKRRDGRKSGLDQSASADWTSWVTASRLIHSPITPTRAPFSFAAS